MLEVRPREPGLWRRCWDLTLSHLALMALGLALIGFCLAPVTALLLAMRVRALQQTLTDLDTTGEGRLARRRGALANGDDRFDQALQQAAWHFRRTVVYEDGVGALDLGFRLRSTFLPHRVVPATRVLDDAAWEHGLRVRVDRLAFHVSRDHAADGWRCEGEIGRCAVGLERLLGVHLDLAPELETRPVSLSFTSDRAGVDALRGGLQEAGFSVVVHGRRVALGPVPEPARSPPPPRACRPVDEIAQRLGTGQYRLEREDFECLLDTWPGQLRALRVVPYERDGHILGLQLFGMRQDGLASALGLRNGDVVLRVNGYDLTSPDTCLEVYARLRRPSSLHVELLREDRTLHLTYELGR